LGSSLLDRCPLPYALCSLPIVIMAALYVENMKEMLNTSDPRPYQDLGPFWSNPLDPDQISHTHPPIQIVDRYPCLLGETLAPIGSVSTAEEIVAAVDSSGMQLLPCWLGNGFEFFK